MLQHLARVADAQGKWVLLEASSPRAVQFFRRHGFEAVGRCQVRAVPLGGDPTGSKHPPCVAALQKKTPACSGVSSRVLTSCHVTCAHCRWAKIKAGQSTRSCNAPQQRERHEGARRNSTGPIQPQHMKRLGYAQQDSCTAKEFRVQRGEGLGEGFQRT